MISYKCKCGGELQMADNSEIGRKLKRKFKVVHDKKKPGHGWIREKVKRNGN